MAGNNEPVFLVLLIGVEFLGLNYMALNFWSVELIKYHNCSATSPVTRYMSYGVVNPGVKFHHFKPARLSLRLYIYVIWILIQIPSPCPTRQPQLPSRTPIIRPSGVDKRSIRVDTNGRVLKAAWVIPPIVWSTKYRPSRYDGYGGSMILFPNTYSLYRNLHITVESISFCRSAV